MTTQTEALKMALEALKYEPINKTSGEKDLKDQAITAIKEALANHIPDATKMVAQPEQETVAFLTNHRQRMNVQIKPEAFVWMPTTTDWEIPLYTTPQQRTWVGLTDKEIAWEFPDGFYGEKITRFARSIEAKLKEKNT